MKRLLATLSLLGALGMGMAFGGSAWAQDAAAEPAAAVAVEAAASAEAAAPAAEAPAVAEAAAAATDAPAPSLSKADNTWILVCAALVILMSIPGLALFYGGLVRSKNMLSVLMQVFVTFSLISVLWVVYGYSLAFTEGGSFFGVLDKLFLDGVTPDSLGATFSKGVYISEFTFVIFQGAFAAITCGLIVGAFAERAKFSAVLVFMVLWFTFSYLPMAHMVWYWAGPDAYIDAAAGEAAGKTAGFLFQKGALDFAGGTVVHINAAIAGLVGAYMIGKRSGLGNVSMAPHSLTFTMIGASLLWFGWFGFNAGSAFAANGTAGYAWVSTSAATAAAMLSWGFTEKIRTGHYTAMGAASGIVAGLVAITPAADVVSPLWAIVLGAIAGVLTCLACGLKFKLGYDDSLDVVGVHGVGGFTGTVLIGFFGEGTGLFAGGDWRQLVVQLIVALVAIVWSAVITGIIAFALEKTIGWRVTEAQEVGGIDLADQGERAYDFAGTASSVLKEVK